MCINTLNDSLKAPVPGHSNQSYHSYLSYHTNTLGLWDYLENKCKFDFPNYSVLLTTQAKYIEILSCKPQYFFDYLSSFADAMVFELY